jgi:hypothetical protein
MEVEEEKEFPLALENLYSAKATTFTALVKQGREARRVG